MITLRRLRENHFGENMTTLLTEIIRKYDFENRLEYFVTDNTKSNDVYIDYILQKLLPYLTSTERSNRRSRC